MITRRTLLASAAGAAALALVQGAPAHAAPSPATTGARRWPGDTSANGWRIDPASVSAHRIEGSTASATLHTGEAAAVLLHVARRWHYEIGALDTGEAGGLTTHTTDRRIEADFESNHLSGTALALHPAAYPCGGSERLWPHQERIVRDILADCEGVVVWGGDLAPVKPSHFHITARPGDKVLARVAARLDVSRHTATRTQTAGSAEDPLTPARRVRADRLRRAQAH